MGDDETLGSQPQDQQQTLPEPPPNSGTNLPDPNPQWLDEAQLPSNYEKREE